MAKIFSSAKVALWMILSAFVTLIALMLPAVAQNYPSRPVTLIVLQAPGGITDFAARLIGEQMSKNLGVSVLIDNRTAGSGVAGTMAVAAASPDGYLLCFCVSATLTLLPAQRNDLPYNPEALVPITQLYSVDNLLVVRGDLNIKTLAEFIAHAKAKPTDIRYGTTGVGNIGHLAAELLRKMAGINIVHVPYRGGAPLMLDLLGGQIEAGIVSPLEADKYRKDGKIIPLATVGAARLEIMPEIPTIGETYPGYVAETWAGIVAPPNTPKAISDRIARAAKFAMDNPEIHKKLLDVGASPTADASPEAFVAMMRAERAKWTELMKIIGPIDSN